MVYIFLANGFEESESLITYDVLKRSNVEVNLVSITDCCEVVGAHGLTVCADKTFDEVATASCDAMVLPGGLPGATNLRAHKGLCDKLIAQVVANKLVAAICAAPFILGELNLLKNKKATCYPGFDKYLAGANYTANLIEVDGNIITGKGPAATFDFAFKIVSTLTDETVAKSVRKAMLFE